MGEGGGGGGKGYTISEPDYIMLTSVMQLCGERLNVGRSSVIASDEGETDNQICNANNIVSIIQGTGNLSKEHSTCQLLEEEKLRYRQELWMLLV